MSARYSVDLAADVRDVLMRSTITDSALALPGQLDRKLYERVAKVIEAAGGKWNRKAQAHLFPRDPREVLGLAVETGSIVNQAKALNQFFTPPDLALRVVQSALTMQKLDVWRSVRVLEPSAGAGALADAAAAAGGRVDCIEVDGALVETLRAKGYPTKHMNFLHVTPEPVYDAVVMNPPFTVGQDIKHIRHAFLFLRSGGVLAAIAGAGLTFRSDKATTGFRAWVRELGGTIEALPDGVFREAGTDVRTVLVTVRKP